MRPALLLLAASSMLLAEGITASEQFLIPFADGSSLRAFVVRPRTKGPHAMIFRATPCDPSTEMEALRPMLGAGFAVSVVALERRLPTLREEIDRMSQMVDWFAGQEWINQRVGYSGDGPSTYFGYLGVLSGNGRLTAASLRNGVFDPVTQAEYPGGVFQPAFADPCKLKAEPPASPQPRFRKLSKGESLTVSPYFARANAPVLFTTSWEDAFHPYALQAFERLQSQGGERARGQQKLFIQGRQNPVEALAQETRWFDFWLRKADNGVSKDPVVRYAILDDPRSKSPGRRLASSQWPLSTRNSIYWMNSSGLLSQTSSEMKTSSSSYVFDPLVPVPSAPTPPGVLSAGLHDVRRSTRRPDVLRFVTNSLAQPATIAGTMVTELYVASNAADTDFHVRLVDIYPDGYEALLGEGQFRLRFREGFDRWYGSKPNEVHWLKIELGAIAATVAKGHQIGLLVSSSNFPRFEVHSNRWRDSAEPSAFKPATNTLHHSAEYPSRVVLPLLVERKLSR